MVSEHNKKNEAKPLTYWQRQDLEKQSEAKKKRNIFMSRRSSEEGGTAYETSQSIFIGGKVQSRSRISLVGRNNEGGVGQAAVEGVRSRLGFAKAAEKSAKSGFAKNTVRNSASGTPGGKSSSRPLGFHV